MSFVYHDSGAVGCRCHLRSRRDRRSGQQMADSAALVLQLQASMIPETGGVGRGRSRRLRPLHGFALGL